MILIRSFHFFSLPCIYLLAHFTGSVVSFLNRNDSTSFQILVKRLLWCLKHIERIVQTEFLPFLGTPELNIFCLCLDEKQHHCLPIYLIAYNILTVFSIITRHFVRKHDMIKSIVSMSLTCLCFWESLNAISFWPKSKLDIFIKHFWTHHMIFEEKYQVAKSTICCSPSQFFVTHHHSTTFFYLK